MLKISSFADKCDKIKFELNPKFGTVFTPCYLKMPIKLGQTEQFQAEIRPFQAEGMSPGTAALHYGQSIFEGMKAYRQKDGGIAIFRADLHAKRFKASAQRMMMAEVPEEVFIEALKSYVHFNRENVPQEAGHSLYLRPLLFASDPMIKVGASQNYEFLIMSTIAGNYFSASGFSKKAKVMVNRDYVRAFPGGTGEAKTAGNYAASIYPQFHAAKEGCDQVLYLDAVEHEYIDEMGGMNFFVVRGNELVTPKLNGCILNGVTRRSLLELAPQLGLKPVEERLSFTQLKKDIKEGKVTESFACGTAAIISPIGEFLFKESSQSTSVSIPLDGDFPVTQKLLQTITSIHTGETQAPGDWMFRVNL